MRSGGGRPGALRLVVVGGGRSAAATAGLEYVRIVAMAGGGIGGGRPGVLVYSCRERQRRQ